MSLSLSTDLRKRSDSVVSSQVKPSPQTYLDTRVINSQRKGSLRPSERAQSRLHTKRRLTSLARQIHEPELADKLINCHSRVAVLTCGKHIAKVIPNHTCEFRLCPDCSRRRSKRHFDKYLPKVEAFARAHRVTPVHLVLTQTHRAETLAESVKRLMAAFRKLVRRGFWIEYFRGGMWSVEVTKGKDGLYHTHLHLLAFRSKFFDITLLRSEWQAVTGDSVNLNLKPILETAAVAGGLREVLKYISKPLDIERFTADNLRDFLKIKNMRFFGTFGEFRKFCAEFEPAEDEAGDLSELVSMTRDLVEGCACPRCESPLFELRMSDDELPDFLQKVEASARSKSPPGTS